MGRIHVRRIHVGRVHAISRSTRWRIIAHGGIGHDVSLRRRRHRIAMASPCLARILMAGILVLWKVATLWISGRGWPLGKGVLFIGLKRVRSVGTMLFMAKRHHLARRRLCAAWVATVRKAWVRH